MRGGAIDPAGASTSTGRAGRRPDSAARRQRLHSRDAEDRGRLPRGLRGLRPRAPLRRRVRSALRPSPHPPRRRRAPHSGASPAPSSSSTPRRTTSMPRARADGRVRRGARRSPSPAGSRRSSSSTVARGRGLAQGAGSAIPTGPMLDSIAGALDALLRLPVLPRDRAPGRAAATSCEILFAKGWSTLGARGDARHEPRADLEAAYGAGARRRAHDAGDATFPRARRVRRARSSGDDARLRVRALEAAHATVAQAASAGAARSRAPGTIRADSIRVIAFVGGLPFRRRSSRKDRVQCRHRAIGEASKTHGHS